MMRVLLLLLVLGLLLIVFVRCRSVGGDRPSMVKTITYTPADWPQQLSGDLYLVESSDPSPGILLIHGGGWTRRSRSDMNRLAKKLAGEGFAVFNVSYRFAPKYRFPAQLHDIQLAANWLHDNARANNIDPDRIGAWGYSSGAHLAALLGVLNAGDSLDSPYGGKNARIKAVVAGGIPANLSKFEGGELLNNLIGGPKSEYPQEYINASPETYVKSSGPPFHLYHGKGDKLVPINQAEGFAAALEKANVPFEFKTYKMHNHMTLFMFGEKAESRGIVFLQKRL